MIYIAYSLKCTPGFIVFHCDYILWISYVLYGYFDALTLGETLHLWLVDSHQLGKLLHFRVMTSSWSMSDACCHPNVEGYLSLMGRYSERNTESLISLHGHIVVCIRYRIDKILIPSNSLQIYMIQTFNSCYRSITIAVKIYTGHNLIICWSRVTHNIISRLRKPWLK